MRCGSPADLVNSPCSPITGNCCGSAGDYRAELHQYTATYNADLATFRQTVLPAFQQVEDDLAAVRIYSQQMLHEQEALKSAEEYLNLAMGQYETGVDPYLDVLTAQTTTVLSDEQTLAGLQSSKCSRQ